MKRITLSQIGKNPQIKFRNFWVDINKNAEVIILTFENNYNGETK